MTKTLEAVVRRRWLSPEDAVREVVAFERRFGEKHLSLACHCGLLLILTPELVNLVRINFLEGENIPWIAESNFLLSPLCRLLQEGIYEVEPCIREVLLVELENNFGWKRPFELAEFLWFYLDKQADKKYRPQFKWTQQWIAKAYLNPDSTIRQMKAILDKNISKNNSNLELTGQGVQIPHLVEILAEPLQTTNLWDEHEYLINTSRAVTNLLADEREGLKEPVEVITEAESEEGEFVLISPLIDEFLGQIKKEKKPNFFAYDGASWVGHENLISKLTDKIKGSCRLLILVGITGIGKTALGERLAVGLEDWFLDWNRYLQENFDNEEQTSDFGSVAARLLEKCGEVVTPDDRKDNQRLMYRLVTHLQENRYLIQIDSLENILQGNEKEGTSDFIDEWWVKFLTMWLSDTNNCQSCLIFTSQDLPDQIPTIGTRFQNFWYCQPLSGLEEKEQLVLFDKVGLDVSELAEDKPYLERIGRAYEGNPLALRVIADEIVNFPFNGNVIAYWNNYGKEVEEVEKAIEEAKNQGIIASANDYFGLHKHSWSLRRKVKSRLEKAFNRLKESVYEAYLLLCESSVYRGEVTKDLWLSHLEDWDINEDRQEMALDALRNRYLVEERIDENNQYLLRQHNLIRGVSLEHLRKLGGEDGEYNIKEIEIPPDSQRILEEFDLDLDASKIRSLKRGSQRTQYKGAINWLTKYKPREDANNLEKVQGLYEAFFLFCELEDWERASKIILAPLKTPTKEPLHQQLGTWSYYKKQIEICKKLLKKLDNSLDIKLLNTLANSYSNLGKYAKAIKYCQQALQISLAIGDHQGEGTTFYNLGIVYSYIGEYQKAIEYHEQALVILREIGDRQGEGTTFYNLGMVYSNLRDYAKAIDCHQEALAILREIGDHQGEGTTFYNLGIVYSYIGEYQKAIEYHEQALVILREIGDRQVEGTTLGNLGVIYVNLGEYAKAIEYYQHSLDILREIGSRFGEGETLFNLGNTYLQIQQYNQALDYLQMSLSIFREIGSRANEAKALKKMAELQQSLGEIKLAFEYCEQALIIATELQIPLADECKKLKNQLMEAN